MTTKVGEAHNQMRSLDVPYRTAQRYIEKLEEVGILREVTGQARNRLYWADGILQALESYKERALRFIS